MKKEILKSARLGAIIGFLIAFLYAIVFLIRLESAIPLDAPSVYVIFTNDFFDFEFPFLLQASPFWLFFPTLLGGLVSVLFTYLRYKLKIDFKRFSLLCLLICFGLIFPGISLYFLQLHNLYFDTRLYGAVLYAARLGFPPVLFLNLLLLYPNIIFLLVQDFIKPFRAWFPISERCKSTGSVLVKGSRTL